MTIINALKKATKTTGILPKKVGNKYYYTGKRDELSFHNQDNDAICIHVRRLTDVTDIQTDYFAGCFYDNLTQVLRYFDK